ncbi:MAG: methyltransferase domain-containing protein [Burkholderiaceae bacterium]
MSLRESERLPWPGQSEAMLREYYERRAPEYERIYAKPERQTDLARLRRAVAHQFVGRTVLDVACGTGYWTACFATEARQTVGVDVNPGVLDVARGKALARTRFTLGDAYGLSEELGKFDAAFIGFWWSHVPKRELARFLTSVHARLVPGARVVLLDNAFVNGSSTPIGSQDSFGDTWQERVLDDGTHHHILKNFPNYEELLGLLGPYARDTHWWKLEYYWWFDYTLR